MVLHRWRIDESVPAVGVGHLLMSMVLDPAKRSVGGQGLSRRTSKQRSTLVHSRPVSESAHSRTNRILTVGRVAWRQWVDGRRHPGWNKTPTSGTDSMMDETALFPTNLKGETRLHLQASSWVTLQLVGSSWKQKKSNNLVLVMSLKFRLRRSN